MAYFGGVKKWIAWSFLFFIAITNIVIVCKPYEVYAKAQILRNGKTVSGSSGNSNGGACTANDKKWRIDCAYTSWIYFKWTGKEYSNPIIFGDGENSYLWNDDSKRAEIPLDCKEAGGFWHYGINRQWTDPRPASYFGRFSGDKDKWGHWWTLSYKSASYLKVDAKSPISQKILNSRGEALFVATKINTSILESYKEALLEEYRQENKLTKKNKNKVNALTDVDAGVYMFCSWGDKKEKTELNVVAKNAIDNSTIKNPDKTVEKDKFSTATVERVSRSDSYKFIGWKESEKKGTTGLITATTANKNNRTFLSDKSTATLNGGAIYKKAHVYMGESKTIYAYYVPKLPLTIITNHATVTVLRKYSTYSESSSDPLKDGSDIYNDDYLRICVSPEEGYTLETFNVNNVNLISQSGKYCTNTKANLFNVTGPTTIEAIANSDEPVASFSGRARIKEGTIVDNTNSTGYVTQNATKSITVPCLNAGCRAAWDLAIQRDSGKSSSTTNYKVGVSSNGGGITWLPSSSFWTFPTSNVTSLVNSGTGSSADTLRPGQSKCHYVRFKPTPDNTASTVDVGACWTAGVSTFEGKTTVSGTSQDNSNMGYVSQNTTKRLIINNCSSVTGCKVTFSHDLKRTSGIGSTDYRIERTSNLTETERRISNQSNLANGTFNEENPKTVKADGPLTLYPGMEVCETMYFKPNNNTVTVASEIATSVCVEVPGNAQPPDPTDGSGDAFIEVKVMNENVEAYKNYMSEVYAKPTDNLTFRPKYNPVLQYTYYLYPQQMIINNGSNVYSNNSSNPLTLGAAFNNNKGNDLKKWNNAFRLYSENFTTSNSNKDFIYEPGDYELKVAATNSYKVQTSDVGKSLNEVAKTNVVDAVMTTPSQVSFTVSDSTSLANIITTPISSTAFARIPYNFYNDSSIATTDGMVLYAGEKKVINIKLIVNPRKNTVTDGEYATLVKNAKKGIMVCDGNDRNCSEPLIEEAGTLNSNGLTKGSTEKQNITITVPDVVAGSKVCLHSGIYPSNSGALTNYSDEKGSNAWKWSDKVCLTVAKRPSFQVWGGNIYSSSNIKVGLSTKNHLAGEEYKANVANGPYIFGSWGELGLITTGQVSELASGATLGYSGINLWANPGGGGKNEHGRCQRALLTVPNSSLCYTSGMSLSMNLGSLTQQKNSNETKTALIDKFKENNYTLGNDVTVVDLGVEPSEDIKRNNGMGLYHYYHSKNNIQLNAATIGMNTIKVVQADGDITINGDLRYENAIFTSYDAMPKLLIYGKNINISCGVNQIDAVLIADKTVNTCGDSDNINSEKNARQLRVNGAIIANGLYLNRTFGARPGNDSIVPAEIINFDSSLYVFGSSKTEVTNSNDLVVTYTREVAPRR